MTDPSASSVVNTLLEEFGDNAAYALELYARYRLEPASVEENWKRTFQELEERVPHAMAGTEAFRSMSTPLLPPRAAPLAVPALPPARPPLPAARPGELAVAIAGGAATIARNMEASLGVPTAVTNRVIPVKTMEENRRILNRHREALGLSKVSFTHFVAWAIVRALEKHPTMNDAFGEVDGKPARIRKPDREPRHRDRHHEEGRHAEPSRPEHQGRRIAVLRRVPRGIRRDGREGAKGNDRAGRVRRHVHHAHESRHDRHDGVGAAPHAGAGRDHRDGRDGVSGRVPGHARGGPLDARHLARDERLLHVRPPHHPGRRVRPVHRRPAGPPPRGRRLLRAHLLGPQGAAPADALGEGLVDAALGGRPRPRGRREAGARPAAHQRVPRARPPRGGPEPARQRRRSVPPGPRPRHVRLHAVGSRPAVHHERPRRKGQGHAARDPRGSAADVLRKDRRRVHVQPGPRAEAVAHRPHGVDAQPLRPLGRRPAANPEEARRGRELREVPPHEVRRPEALLAGRRRGRDPASRPPAGPRGRGRARRGRHRHVAPRAAHRPHEHRRQAGGEDLRGVRGRGRPRVDPGLGRREVPPRRVGHARGSWRRAARHLARPEPEPPRGRGSRRGRHGAREADAPRGGPRARQGPARSPARRRGVRRPGNRGRDDQHVAAPRLPHGRHRARRREQPDRLHDEPGRRALVAVLHGRREDGAIAGLPRERRRPGGRRPRRGHRDRLPQHVPARRRDRPRLLSALRPQRGGRAELHAARDVPEDQEPRLGRAPLRRVARQAGPSHRGRGGRTVGVGEGRAGARVRRSARHPESVLRRLARRAVRAAPPSGRRRARAPPAHRPRGLDGARGASRSTRS